jgi:hypothetical protein
MMARVGMVTCASHARRTGHHADARHFGHHLAPIRRQAMVVVVATAAAGAIAVVRQQHPAHAQLVIQLDQAGLAADGARALDIEADAELAFAPGPFDICDRVHQQVVGRTRPDPAPQLRQHLDVLLHRVVAETDIHRHHAHPGPARPFELGQESVVVRPQGHAGVVIPHQARCEQLLRAWRCSGVSCHVHLRNSGARTGRRCAA